MKRLLILSVILALLLAAFTVPAGAEEEPITIVYHNNALTTEGSNPEVVARVQQYILDEIGVLVKSIVPMAMTT